MKRVKEIYDHAGRTLTRVIIEDVEPLIEDVVNSRNSLRNGFGRSKNYRKIGSIPMIWLDQWFREGFNALENSPETRKELKRRLNEFNKFRTVDRML